MRIRVILIYVSLNENKERSNNCVLFIGGLTQFSDRGHLESNQQKMYNISFYFVQI